jgi:hypothetical protein
MWGSVAVIHEYLAEASQGQLQSAVSSSLVYLLGVGSVRFIATLRVYIHLSIAYMVVVSDSIVASALDSSVAGWKFSSGVLS